MEGIDSEGAYIHIFLSTSVYVTSRIIYCLFFTVKNWSENTKELFLKETRTIEMKIF